MTRVVLIVLALLLLPTGGALAAPASPQPSRVQYDAAQDRLTLSAERASLRQLLGAIAARSGIQVLFDPAAEETVSLTLRDAPLEPALKQLLKGKNTTFTYRDAAPGKTPVLAGVRVLPRGKNDTSGLQPLSDSQTAAVEQRDAAREQRQAERRERQAARKAEDERLKAEHPEVYAQRQQQIEENRKLRAQGIGRVKLNVEIKEN